MRLKRGGYVSAAVIVVLATACAPTPSGPHPPAISAPAISAPAISSPIQRGSIELGGSPGIPAVDSRTGTLYVPVQCATSYCTTSAPTHEMDVISTAGCNAEVTKDCRVVATARVGASPLAATVDETTDTVYVANGAGTVTVVNGARCNATVMSGCGTPLATINVGGFLVAAVIDPNTHTLYVASPPGNGFVTSNVFVINVATCNAVTTQGCGQPVKKVADSQGPAAIDVDLATDTIYAVNNGTGNGNTVSVIDGAKCNGSTGSGCGEAPHTITVGSGAFWDAVDQASGTVYVANNNDGTVSVIDGARCNATVTSGCSSMPKAVVTGAGAASVAVDASLHTVFALNADDDTLSAVDTRTCNGAVTSGCGKVAPNAQAGSDQDPGYTGFPNSLTLLPHTDTAYVVNVGGESRVSVITVGRCDATNRSGCRVLAPDVPIGEFQASVDRATDTIYASNLSLPEIDVLNGATCDAKHRSRCTPVAEIPMRNPQAAMGAVDDLTHTLYASDSSGTVSVINTAMCNAAHTAGCTRPAPMITVGATGSPVLNPTTRTLYVPFGAHQHQIAVVNVAACSAENTAACGQTPAVITAGQSMGEDAVIAVSAKTDTIYIPFASADTVGVVNGATCNGTDHSGCGRLAATVTVGLGPDGVAVDDQTNTVYVANNAEGDAPGTVSVINGATCNGSETAGCTGNIPAVGIGRSPRLVAIDLRTDVIYVTDYSSAGVSVLNGLTCNATITTGCSTAAPEQPVGSQPYGLGVNAYSNTVYALSGVGPVSMSIFGGRP
jgi:DNA-binding beta-propeller fold protein YncE